MSHDTVFISVMSQDRVGLVAAIAGCLFDLGGDLSDTTFAVLGGGAEFASVCAVPADLAPETIDQELRALPQLAGAQVAVTRFRLAAVHDETARVTHRLTLRGGNRPGLIARLCEVFVQFHANVVRLDAERIPGEASDDYAIEFAVSIPAAGTSACIATVANTAGELGLSFSYQTT